MKLYCARRLYIPHETKLPRAYPRVFLEEEVIEKISKLEAEIEDLKEYKHKYEGLCK